MAGLLRRAKKKPLWGTCIGIFAGQYYDQETGLHYNYWRFYDPDLGRYLRADPIGLDGGINLYAYVKNDPVNFVDPLGLVSAGQLGIGNPGSYGGENDCESMHDERGPWYFSDIIDLEYKYYGPMVIGVIPPPSGVFSNIVRIAQGKGIRKLEKLKEKWGGRGRDWRKMKGWDENGQEWHWYQKRGDGTKYGLKPKGDLDPF